MSSGMRLRPARLADAAAMARWRNQPWVRAGYFYQARITPGRQRRWLAETLARPDARVWIIEAPKGRGVGMVGLYHVDAEARAAEFGWLVIGERDVLGRGIATSATRRVLRYGFRRLRLHRITLLVRTGNPAARRLYAKFGFREEGRLRRARWTGRGWADALLMAVLEREVRLS